MNISSLDPFWSWGENGQGEKKFFFFLWLPRRRSTCWKKLRWSCYPIGIYLCLKHGKIWRPEGRKERERVCSRGDTINALPKSRSNRICHVTRGRRKKRKAAGQQQMRHCVTLEMICQFHSKKKKNIWFRSARVRKAKRTRLLLRDNLTA